MADSETDFGRLISTHVPRLVQLVDASTLSELEITLGDLRITLRRMVAPAAAAPLRESAVSAALPRASDAPATLGSAVAQEEPEGKVITAPMVGTFYTAPVPGAPPFVQEGDIIEPGQVIGIIEAMKVMNEIEAEFGGRVVRLIAQSQQPVEFGQALMLVATE